MKIGIFGGSFDPIHKGHLKIADEALRLASLDKIIFVPSGISPHKEKLNASALDRFNMVCEVVSDNPFFFVSDYEIKKKTRSYTYETITEFKKLYPDDEFFFIMGDDEYLFFPNWYEKDKLLTMCTFLVFTRKGLQIKPPFIKIETPPLEVSSSNIRALVSEDKDISPFVHELTASYIKQHKLYK